MFTLIGAMIGFAAMLIARGRAGVAASMALLGLLFGFGASLVFGIEDALTLASTGDLVNEINAVADGQPTQIGLPRWVAGLVAASPGVLGAFLARRD